MDKTILLTNIVRTKLSFTAYNNIQRKYSYPKTAYVELSMEMTVLRSLVAQK